jgi:hypothetical protein
MKFTTELAVRIAIASLIAMVAPAIASPKSVRASYNVTLNGMSIGTITEQYDVEGEKYRVVSDTKPMGLAALIQRQPLRFSSAGYVGRDGLRPVHFEARRTPTDAPQVVAEFDWTAGQVLLKHEGQIESVALPAGTQDRLSVMYQFMFLPLERARQIEFSMTNGRKLDHYRYQVAPDVDVETGLGRLKAVHLAKVREPGETVNEIWLSQQHQYFPVRMMIVERNGMRFEQVILSLELRE